MHYTVSGHNYTPSPDEYKVASVLRDFIRNKSAVLTANGATYNADTTWPEGFNPEAAGAVLVEDDG